MQAQPECKTDSVAPCRQELLAELPAGEFASEGESFESCVLGRGRDASGCSDSG